MQYVIIPPEELKKRLDLIHSAKKNNSNLSVGNDYGEVLGNQRFEEIATGLRRER